MFEFIDNAQSTEKLKEFQLNYDMLKKNSETLKCKHYEKCIINLDKVSEIFNTYYVQLQRSIEEKDRLRNEQSRSDNINQTVQIFTVDPSLENISDNALFDLFSTEVQNSKSDLKFLKETLNDLSIGYDSKTNYETSNSFGRNHRNLKTSMIECNKSINQDMKNDEISSTVFFMNENGRLCMPQNEMHLEAVIGDENLNCLPLNSEVSAEELQSGNTEEITNNDIKINNLKNISPFHQNTSEGKSSTSVDRPFSCSRCKMAFKRNVHLKRHFLVKHTANKNFVCNFCGKSFSRKDYLDKHKGGHQKKNFKLKLLEQGIVVRTKIYSKSNMKK